MSQSNLPFKVGDTVELRSFEHGYRGAWFRCKITKIFKKGRTLFYNVEYPDYPGEEIGETKVFERLEGGDHKYLMIRPPFPRLCHVNEDPSTVLGLQEVLLVPHVWKVGDLVDWWKDYCYWSGTVLQVCANGSVKIELLPEPHGEGGTYDDCLSKDLRPSLEWSLEHGWTVPFSEDGDNRQCAKLMKPWMEEHAKGEEQVKVEEPVKGEEPEKRLVQELKGNGGLRLNIMDSDSIEAAVMDLEELVVRIEWLKDMIAQDTSNSSETSSWKYEDHRPSSSRM